MVASAPETERLISVIMPAYNVAGYVEETVASAHAQTWPRIQLVAVDDGSTDGTRARLHEIARGWTAPGRRMEVVAQANAGAAAARNTGLARAEGEFVAFLDADDRWHPELLARLAALLDREPDADMAFPRYRYIDGEGRPIGVESALGKRRFDAVDLMGANPVHSATGVLLRAEAAGRTGLFDTGLEACIDLDYWVRLGALRPGNIAGLDAVLVDYRKREGQITGDWRRMERNWMRVCDKLAQAGRLRRAEFRRCRGQHCLYWATIAYKGGDHRAARRLIAEAWWRAPVFVLGDRFGVIRTLACIASLLPRPMHDALQRRFNARS